MQEYIPLSGTIATGSDSVSHTIDFLLLAFTLPDVSLFAESVTLLASQGAL